MKRQLTKLEWLLLLGNTLLLAGICYVWGRVEAQERALSQALQNRIVMQIPATDRTNYATSYETNH